MLRRYIPVNEPERQPTNDEAARWVVRLESGPLSAEEEREFNTWIEIAPHHRGALIRAKAVWHSLDRLGAVAGPTGQGRGSESEVERPESATPRKESSTYFRRGPVVAALAASLAVLTIGALGYLVLGDGAYVTAVGEVRRLTLEDGSRIVLNSGSRLAVRFQAATRDVVLERGEALFEVAKNPGRPFIVHTGDVSVRAVGTAFSVRRAEETVSISVTEGVVEVSEPQIAPQRVAVNEQATVRPTGGVLVTHEDESTMDRQLAWRNGMVSFAGETLGAAVDEVNRYSRRKIVIDDPALRAKPVVGIFRLGDVEAFARTAATAFGAEVHADDGVLRLTPPNQP